MRVGDTIGKPLWFLKGTKKSASLHSRKAGRGVCDASNNVAQAHHFGTGTN